MRAIWSGSISFGLVNVPVKAYSAVQDHDVRLHQVHDADGGRIRYQRRCEVCGKKVDYEHIDKAYDDGEDTVVLTDEDFAALPAADNDEIQVVQFIPADQLDPMMLEKSYYLEPQGKSPKSYLLLRQTLERTDLIAVVKFALRQKTRLGVLHLRDNLLVLQSMLWGDELREVDFPGASSRAKISPKELKMSAALVKQFASDFAPEEYEDDYQVELRTLIDAKLEAGDALDTAATFGEEDEETGADEDGGEGEEQDAEVIDLMDALKSSLDRKRGPGGTSGRSGGGQASSGSKRKSGTSSKTSKDSTGTAKKSRATSSSKSGKSSTSGRKSTGKSSGKSTSSRGRSTPKAKGA